MFQYTIQSFLFAAQLLTTARVMHIAIFSGWLQWPSPQPQFKIKLFLQPCLWFGLWWFGYGLGYCNSTLPKANQFTSQTLRSGLCVKLRIQCFLHFCNGNLYYISCLTDECYEYVHKCTKTHTFEKKNCLKKQIS